MNAEERRLQESNDRRVHWKRWGPYLSERAWGTVREDYSAGGTAWEYFPHDHARSRAYRWNEDGLAGISDRRQTVCFAVALWNEQDPILKERLFGLTGNEGNHGEDVKEYYFYLDSAPTHSYMKYLYKYPQRAYPYAELVEVNRSRSRQEPEFELSDTGVFADDRYFDVFVEYAKASAEDILVRITAVNRAHVAAPLHVLPTIWFRNTWSWTPDSVRPQLRQMAGSGAAVELEHPESGRRTLRADGQPRLLFTENETNAQRLFGVSNATPFVKDGRDVGVLLEPLTVVEKGITQAYEIQRRLRVWRPKKAAVMGAGTIGLLAALVLRLRGLDVTVFGLRQAPYRNSELLETLTTAKDAIKVYCEVAPFGSQAQRLHRNVDVADDVSV